MRDLHMIVIFKSDAPGGANSIRGRQRRPLQQFRQSVYDPRGFGDCEIRSIDEQTLTTAIEHFGASKIFLEYQCIGALDQHAGHVFALLIARNDHCFGDGRATTAVRNEERQK